MVKVNALIANGTEECELLNVVDLLRRADCDVSIVSIDGITVKSSHGVTITADETAENVVLEDCDVLFIPGGMPGSARLGECERLIVAIEKALDGGKRVAAICAAPALVLGKNGFLNGKKATCFPGFEQHMGGAILTDACVETDGSITTARGLGCSFDLGLELIALTSGKDKAEEIKKKIQYRKSLR